MKNNDITNKIKQLSNKNCKTKNNEDSKSKELSNDISNNSNIQVTNENKSIISNDLTISTKSNSISRKILLTTTTLTQNIEQKTECNSSKLFNELKEIIIDKNIKKDNYSIKTLDFIKEIKINNNIYHLIGGFNNPLYLCGKNFKNLIRLDDIIDDIVYNVSEININIQSNLNTIKIALSSVNGIYIYNLDLSEGILKNKIIDNYIEYPALQFLEIDVNHKKYHITFGDNGVILFENLCNKIFKEKSFPIVKEPVYGGISIFKNIIAFVSNNILSKKEKSNKIIFYNVLLKKIIKEIKFDYSINLAQNSLGLMEYTKKNKSHKLLLCACKKYKKNQKNMILIVNYDFSTGEKIKINFENTGSFEVYCFCQLSNYEKNIHLDNKYIKKTNYFLVGGFDINKGKGIIKLYRLILMYKNQNKKVKISYLEDVILSDGRGCTSKNIRAPISCINQSNDDGKISVTTWGNNMYSFNSPNINSSYKKILE